MVRKNNFMSYSCIRKKEHTLKDSITLSELKEALLNYYYDNLDSSGFNQQMSREFIITTIKNCYGEIGSIVFSVNGSPAKGEAILIKDDCYSKLWRGNLIFFKNGKPSKPIRIEIIDDRKKDH